MVYALVFWGSGDRLGTAELTFRSDEEAMLYAWRLAGGRTVELWRQGKLVGRVKRAVTSAEFAVPGGALHAARTEARAGGEPSGRVNGAAAWALD